MEVSGHLYFHAAIHPQRKRSPSYPLDRRVQAITVSRHRKRIWAEVQGSTSHEFEDIDDPDVGRSLAVEHFMYVYLFSVFRIYSTNTLQFFASKFLNILSNLVYALHFRGEGG
jgi:hypothetical protein